MRLVVPLVGTWIEIKYSSSNRLHLFVVPLVGTWIEILNISFKSPLTVVVPLVGTWIEICEHRQIEREPVVVPLVGTWIEIYNDLLNATIALSSFPSWERGLKSKKGGAKWKWHRSFPSWERGLKFMWKIVMIYVLSSRSPRGNVD